MPSTCSSLKTSLLVCTIAMEERLSSTPNIKSPMIAAARGRGLNEGEKAVKRADLLTSTMVGCPAHIIQSSTRTITSDSGSSPCLLILELRVDYIDATRILANVILALVAMEGPVTIMVSQKGSTCIV